MKKVFFFALTLASLLLGSVGHAEITALPQTVTNDPATFPLKSHHAKLRLQCENCHQEADPKLYKRLKTNDCLACHGSAQKVANRTLFMDANHTNPHNSLHDRLDLDCYECHAEHRPSLNLCQTCHDNTRDWFGPTP